MSFMYTNHVITKKYSDLAGGIVDHSFGWVISLESAVERFVLCGAHLDNASFSCLDHNFENKKKI